MIRFKCPPPPNKSPIQVLSYRSIGNTNVRLRVCVQLMVNPPYISIIWLTGVRGQSPVTYCLGGAGTTVREEALGAPTPE